MKNNPSNRLGGVAPLVAKALPEAQVMINELDKTTALLGGTIAEFENRLLPILRDSVPEPDAKPAENPPRVTQHGREIQDQVNRLRSCVDNLERLMGRLEV